VRLTEFFLRLSLIPQNHLPKINRSAVVADINIERKKTNIWPWIIGILLILALLWAFMNYRTNARATSADTTAIQADTAIGAGTATSTRP
jgi:hypothetical protein